MQKSITLLGLFILSASVQMSGAHADSRQYEYAGMKYVEYLSGPVSEGGPYRFQVKDYDTETYTILAAKQVLPDLQQTYCSPVPGTVIDLTQTTVYSITSVVGAYEVVKDYNLDSDLSLEAGDRILELTSGKEGYCTLNVNGRILTSECPSNQVADGDQRIRELMAPFVKAYVQLPCADGNTVWIDVDYLSENTFLFENLSWKD